MGLGAIGGALEPVCLVDKYFPFSICPDIQLFTPTFYIFIFGIPTYTPRSRVFYLQIITSCRGTRNSKIKTNTTTALQALIIMENTQSAIRSRKSHHKSRLGCGNCKRRRIKVSGFQTVPESGCRLSQASPPTIKKEMDIKERSIYFRIMNTFQSLICLGGD